LRVTRRTFLQVLGGTAGAAALARGQLTTTEQAGQNLERWATPEEVGVPSLCPQCPGGCGWQHSVLPSSASRGFLTRWRFSGDNTAAIGTHSGSASLKLTELRITSGYAAWPRSTLPSPIDSCRASRPP